MNWDGEQGNGITKDEDIGDTSRCVYECFCVAVAAAFVDVISSFRVKEVCCVRYRQSANIITKCKCVNY